MQIFHIVLTAIFAAGSCTNVVLIVLTYDKRIHTAFNIGTAVLNLIVFYSIAAYAISTNNWALYWSALIVNAAIGIYNAKRIEATPEFKDYIQDKHSLL